MEIMLRRKKRNQVLVGEGELESVVNDLLSKIEKGELGVLKDIQIEDNNTDANLDDVTIGSCKIKNLKSTKGGAITKKMKIGWTSKAKDKILTTDVDDLENNENSVQSPIDNNKINDDNVNMVIDIDRRIGNVNVNSSRKRGTRVFEDGGKTDPEAQDLNVSSERNGVKVWLN
ncbi:hypothetical protein P3L10_028273 [Capsicum annuum]